ncbi:MAG: acetyl-CoA carboxylase biotin carboxyl carrier protein subunit [Actinobacteria bacterium]|nr:acetyl-CoA carboxylase biotin carboxyl carrier protein subunit [Actinomycetota bacterium]MBO0831797.1 acetyl-CoA carboxylase biotin carboxyl carrier protein subunit [Actinomycetota bacterium]MBO0834730.1 acetyl-CoA carboxylase biotin carboxyl carrier protein subunit [Actinomycetota bacterium]
MELTAEDVRDILELLDGLPYAELTLETASFRLALRRDPDGAWTQAMEVVSEPQELAEPNLPAADAMPVAAEASPAAASPESAEAGLVDVRAPLLGTFYRAPRPGAPPFVTVGSEVATDTVVCIIETMKLMNSVSAGVDGKVAEILLENAQFAPQGTVLMRVRPNGAQQ